MAVLKRQMLATIDTIAVIMAGLVFAISIGGFFAHGNWRLAWYSNPRPHLAAMSALLLAWFWGRQNKVAMAGLLGLSLGVNLLVLIPLFVQPDLGPVTTLPLTIAHLNTNRGRAALADLNPLKVDILLLQEVTPELNQELPQKLAAYELIESHPLPNTHGSAVLVHQASPIEILETNIIHLPDTSDRPLIATRINFAGQPITLLSLHLIRPQRAGADRYQQRELEAVAHWSRDIQQMQGDAVIIMGDFNVTPWSNRFLKLLAEGNLYNSLRGYGLQNTWPSTLPLMFGLPIDHAIYSGELATSARSTRTVAGSDHALLQVALVQHSP